MSAQIIDRGRGPEIAGTRVTLYRIMDYLRENANPERIATELNLTQDEVSAALAYVDEHRAEVSAAYDAILERLRNQQAAAPLSTISPDDLKQRIVTRTAGAVHARAGRQ